MSRSKFYCRPRFFLALSALVGTAALGVYFFRSVHVYRDVAYCYAYAVREAAVHGNWSYVLDPGLPMLNMALGALVALTGMEARHAVMLVGGAFYILAIFPLYFLLKRFVSPLAASLGCLIFILTPKVMRFHCSGLLESARDFFFIASLLMLFRLSERKNFANLALFALSLTGLALARAESIVIACCFILLLPLRDLWSYRHSFTAGKFCRSLLLCLAAGLLLLAFVSPKLAYNFRKTGYPTVDTRFNPYLNALFKWDRFVSPPPDAVPADTLSSSASALKNGKFAWGENILSLFENLLRGGYELYWGVAIIGILLCVFRLSKRVHRIRRIDAGPLRIVLRQRQRVSLLHVHRAAADTVHAGGIASGGQFGEKGSAQVFAAGGAGGRRHSARGRTVRQRGVAGVLRGAGVESRVFFERSRGFVSETGTRAGPGNDQKSPDMFFLRIRVRQLLAEQQKQGAGRPGRRFRSGGFRRRRRSVRDRKCDGKIRFGGVGQTSIPVYESVRTAQQARH